MGGGRGRELRLLYLTEAFTYTLTSYIIYWALVHFLDRHLFSQVPVLGMDLQEAVFSLRILVAGERCNATGECFKRGSTSE